MSRRKKKTQRSSLRIRAACCSDRGLIRPKNEDNFWFDGKYMDAGTDGSDGILSAAYEWPLPSGEDLFFAVFDGVGGAQYGEQASTTASMAAGNLVSRLGESGSVELPSILDDLYSELNQAVLRRRDELDAYDICTTAVSLLFHDDHVWCSNAGDSRCYVFKDGELTQISVDHNTAQAFLMLGITYIKPMLTQYLGQDTAELEFRPTHSGVPFESGTAFVLCSDGLTDLVNERRIRDILADEPDPDCAVEALVASSLANGGRDNITVIVVRIG